MRLKRFLAAAGGITLLIILRISSAEATGAPLAVAEQKALLAEAPAVSLMVIQHHPLLVWANWRHPERAGWETYAFGVIDSILDQLDTARDITDFCPTYRALSRNERIVAWAQMFAGISYFESSFDPTNRTLETAADRGVDDITGQPVYSEGLLQLSYQDTTQDQVGPMCRFDWGHDQHLSETDQHRTILNPYTNLFCGIHMMAKYLSDNAGKIVVSDHYYWSTLQAGNRNEERVEQIQHMVRRLRFCHR